MSMANRIDRWPNKDPEEELDFDIDWAGTADDPGRAYNDPLISSEWFIDTPNDGALILGTDVWSAIATKIWVTGGTLNKRYQVTNRVETVGGRIMDKSGYIPIREK